MHSISALRFYELLRLGDWGGFWREFHKPEFYTPLGRLGMGLGYLSGLGYTAPRFATALAWLLATSLCIPLTRRVTGSGPVGSVASALCVAMMLGSWLAVSYCRTAYLEAWSAAILLITVHTYLRARDRDSGRWALACGLLLGAAVLVKSNYGLFAVGAVGLSGLSDLVRRPAGLRSGALARNVFIGLASCLGWWFFLPLPMGLEYGALHRDTMLEYLTKHQILTSHGPRFLAVAWGLMACHSLAVFAIQVVGLLWALPRWSNPATRMCAILGIVAPLAFALAPYRIDRFLLPTLFGACVLGAAATTLLIARLRTPLLRVCASGVLAAVVLGLPNLGKVRVLQWTFPGDYTPDQLAAMGDASAQWSRPFAERPAPAGGPAGTEALLRSALQHMDPKQAFLWIGGTGTEWPPTLVDWTLYTMQRDPSILFRARDQRAWFLSEPTGPSGAPWNEQEFRDFTRAYPQVFVLDPPDPKGRPREFEQRYAQWMANHPGFQAVAQVAGRLGDREFHVRVYRPAP